MFVFFFFKSMFREKNTKIIEDMYIIITIFLNTYLHPFIQSFLHDIPWPISLCFDVVYIMNWKSEKNGHFKKPHCLLPRIESTFLNFSFEWSIFQKGSWGEKKHYFKNSLWGRYIFFSTLCAYQRHEIWISTHIKKI